MYVPPTAPVYDGAVDAAPHALPIPLDTANCGWSHWAVTL